MRKLNDEEHAKLIKLIIEIRTTQDGKQLSALNSQALKIVHGNAKEIDQWLKENSRESISKINKLFPALNAFSDANDEVILMRIGVKNKLLSAGRKLLQDFQGAEKDATEALGLASGNPQLYNQYNIELKDYFDSDDAKQINAQKKLGLNVSYPQEILDKQKFITTAKIIVNTMANSLMVTSPEFKANRIAYIKQALSEANDAKFLDRNGQMQFRAIRPQGDYGKPEFTFQEGLAPQFISFWGFQSGVISQPYVNDVFKVEGEKAGWTGGISSTSANLKFCASFDFAASFGMQDGFIYVYACDEAASVARHITFGVGYDGKVDKAAAVDRSNAEAAMEYMLPYLSPDRIVGAREVKADGTLGDFFPNPNINHCAYGDVEYLKLMLCNNVNEIKLVEFLERRSVEVRHQDAYPDYVNKMIELFSALPPDRKAVVMKLAHSSEIALNVQLVNNLDPQLKENDPIKWQMLHQLQLSENPEHSLAVLPESIKSALSEVEYEAMAGHVKKQSDIQVASHFGFEFERDKRSSKEKPAEEKEYGRHRFYQKTKEAPASDNLEQVTTPGKKTS